MSINGHLMSMCGRPINDWSVSYKAKWGDKLPQRGGGGWEVTEFCLANQYISCPCLFNYMNLVFKISKNWLDGSGSFFGTRLFHFHDV